MIPVAQLPDYYAKLNENNKLHNNSHYYKQVQ